MGTSTMKKVKATPNNVVFTQLDTGQYYAQVLGYEVILTREMHNLWEVRVIEGKDEGMLLAADSTRTKALKSAFHNVLRREEKRLDWVLADQPLRKYGKRGPYKTDIDTSSPNKRDEKTQDWLEGEYLPNEEKPHLQLVDTQKLERKLENEDVQPMAGKLADFLTVEQKLRIRKFYAIRKNHMQGGFNVVKFDSKGVVNGFEGPYDTAGKAYEKIIELEGIEIPEEE